MRGIAEVDYSRAEAQVLRHRMQSMLAAEVSSLFRVQIAPLAERYQDTERGDRIVVISVVNLSRTARRADHHR